MSSIGRPMFLSTARVSSALDTCAHIVRSCRPGHRRRCRDGGERGWCHLRRVRRVSVGPPV